MPISVSTKAFNKSLVTLDDLKTAIASGDSDDTFLADLIVRASSAFNKITRRTMAREIITETLQGSGRTELLMSRFPIVNISEARLDTVEVTASSYQILDSGILYRKLGWNGDFPVGEGLTLSQLPMQGDLNWAIDYTSGFLLPPDDISSSLIAADSSAKTFTFSSGTWPLLVADDSITFTGWDSSVSGNNATFTIITRTASVLTVSETVTTRVEGDSIVGVVQTLPEEIEQVCIEIVNNLFLNRNKNSTIKSEKIADWSATYIVDGGSIVLSSFGKDVLEEYKVKF